MRTFSISLVVTVIALGLGSCAEPTTTVPAAKTSPAGSRFDGVGKVALHAGQPCSPQIMFDFRMASSHAPVWLAADVRETKTLTDAARHSRSARVWGRWQRGRDQVCRFVNVAKVELQKSFW